MREWNAACAARREAVNSCSQHVPLKMRMVFLCELDELDPFAIEPIAIPDFKMVQWMKLVCDDAEENS